jgi:hypothetical protein
MPNTIIRTMFANTAWKQQMVCPAFVTPLPPDGAEPSVSPSLHGLQHHQHPPPSHSSTHGRAPLYLWHDIAVTQTASPGSSEPPGWGTMVLPGKQRSRCLRFNHVASQTRSTSYLVTWRMRAPHIRGVSRLNDRSALSQILRAL